jgi:hypothetical protein
VNASGQSCIELIARTLSKLPSSNDIPAKLDMAVADRSRIAVRRLTQHFLGWIDAGHTPCLARQHLDRHTWTAADVQHAVFAAHVQQANNPGGIAPIGACQDDAAQPTQYAARVAEVRISMLPPILIAATTCADHMGCQNAVRGIKSRRRWRTAR